MLDPQNKMTEFDFNGTKARWRTNRDGMMDLWNAPKTEAPNSHGRVLLRKDGRPRKRCRIVFLDELPGVPLQTWWGDIQPLAGGSTERLGYPTQKPLALLDRIITSLATLTVGLTQRLPLGWGRLTVGLGTAPISR